MHSAELLSGAFWDSQRGTLDEDAKWVVSYGLYVL